MKIYGAITSNIQLSTFSISTTSLICPRGGNPSPVADINGAVSMKKTKSFAPRNTHVNSCHSITAVSLAALASAVISLAAEANALDLAAQQQQQSDTLANVPQLLSGECVSGSQDCKKTRIQRPKSKQAESCTVKCVNTCIRGGLGSPGEGPLNVRRPLVVFKQGFRSRQYWFYIKGKQAVVQKFLQIASSTSVIVTITLMLRLTIMVTLSLVECSDICNLIRDGDDGP